MNKSMTVVYCLSQNNFRGDMFCLVHRAPLRLLKLVKKDVRHASRKFRELSRRPIGQMFGSSTVLYMSCDDAAASPLVNR